MPASIPGPAYRILTSHLVLRCWNPADAVLLKQAVDDSLDHLLPWMAWAKQEPETLQAKIERLRTARGKFDLGQDFTYGIFNPEETAVLGAAGLDPCVGEGAREIGYWIHCDHINRGLATEAVAALVKIAFEVDGVRRVEIHCAPNNARSAAIPKKLGFLHEATLLRRPFGDGNLRDTMIWTLFKEDYPSCPAAGAELQALDSIGRRLL